MEKNDTLEIYKKIYKPYRYTKIGKTIILESTEGKYLLKEKSNNNLSDLNKYLVSRNFDNFPKIIDESRNEYNVYEYIDDIYTPKEQKALDLVDVLGNLHQKTAYFKEVTEDKFKAIYESIINNINYYREYFNNFFDETFNDIYMSPSTYLLDRNISKLLSAFDFAEYELNEWYDLVKEKHKERVSVVHNNVSTDHLIKNDKDYLISWDKSKIDSPILDLVSFYKNEYNEYNFEEIIDKYLTRYELTEYEKKLFFILICIPDELILEGSEYNKTKTINEYLVYIYKTEELIKPYFKNEDKQ